jgi:3-oxoacyl-[acyl-carrier protein] reductase
MELSEAKVLVTGGSSGIGKETARYLVKKGAKVAICARNNEQLKKTAAEIDALPIQADISKEKDVKVLVDATIKALGGFNVLINNAAYGYFSPLLGFDLEKFNDMMSTNVTGTILMARESARYFTEQDYGNIINIGSTAGAKGFAGGTPYCASKFAVNALTECWRAELRKYNIRVMQVNPSEVITNFAHTAGHGQNVNETKLRPDEIAHVITSMLEMDDRGFITDTTVWATNPKD